MASAVNTFPPTRKRKLFMIFHSVDEFYVRLVCGVFFHSSVVLTSFRFETYDVPFKNGSRVYIRGPSKSVDEQLRCCTSVCATTTTLCMFVRNDRRETFSYRLPGLTLCHINDYTVLGKSICPILTH
jgi:hypothetical protein